MSKLIMIAEIASSFTNHEEAIQLLDHCVSNDIKLVKLQSYLPELLASKDAIFSMKNTGNVAQLDIFRREYCPRELQSTVILEARKRGIDIFSTPSHESDVDYLLDMGIRWFKVGSDDALNFPLIEYIARYAEKIFVSTGMSTTDEIDVICRFLSSLKVDACVMHCITSYPAECDDLNLLTIKYIKDNYPKLGVGYSDHFPGNEACIVALALGATVFEKHIYATDGFEGVDAAVGMSAMKFRGLTDQLKLSQKMMGSYQERHLGVQELINRKNNRKSLHTSKGLKRGEKLNLSSIIALRPGYGISPNKINHILNKMVKNDMEEGQIIYMEDLINDCDISSD